MGDDLIGRFQAARRDEGLAVLEGFHAVKHALRFGAKIDVVVSRDLDQLRRLCSSLAPDVEQPLLAAAVPVDPDLFSRLAPTPPDTGVIGIARRRRWSPEELLAGPRASPLVVVERPAHLGNVGAVIRVAAAAGAAGVLTSGPHDPWHPAAIRGAAGLQYAVPVARVGTLPELPAPVLAVHPEGEPLAPGAIPSDAVLVFGSERRGLSPELLARAERRIAIPMTPGVSSLNLATAVAVILYTWRLSARPTAPAASGPGRRAGRRPATESP